MRLNEASASVLARLNGRAETTVGGDRTPYDLSALRIFNKVVLYVKDQYVDPRRVKPKEMMVQALEYVEKTVPEVMVDGTADTGVIKVDVNGKVKEWDIHHVDSLWKMSFTMKDMMDFVAQNMRPIDDARDVEYAAVNGMLSTLDPHTVLLRPEIYRQLQASTKGEFGGLGFVIQMKEGDLTVVKVLPKTPAYRAGIKKDDKIKKIGEESTVNMDLDDAVSKLRGPVDSQVTITIAREGWDKPHAMTLSRAQISLDSVLSKMLSDNVGYVRLKGFQGNTTHDMQEAIAGLEEQTKDKGGLKGLVLDLRGNPGGLLEQAVQVSDSFVANGTLVSTVGYSDKMRDEKKAHEDDGDYKYPMVVLVNAGSASASEIVAGALKNLNRATIIGQQTFGKGSVQMLYDFPDNSALKLTIAKYLTPGDVSIQEVGIEPDIALMPTRVTSEAVNVFAPRKSMGEADLSHHFGNPDSKQIAKSRDEVVGLQKPMEEVKYLKATEKPAPKVAELDKETKSKLEKQKKGKEAKTPAKGGGSSDVLKDTTGTESDEGLYDQLDADVIDEVKEDFEISFARDFVLHAPSVDRQQQLQQGKAWVEQKKAQETERINQAIAGLGVDWSAGPRPTNAELAATVSPSPEKKLMAGENFDFVVTAENHGTQPFHRLRAWTESDDPYFDRRELVFGELKPGAKVSWKVPIKLPKDFTTRREDVTVKFYDDQGPLPTQVVSELDLIELPRPSFAFNWQVLDQCDACNGNGIAEKGEQIQLLLDVTNVGKGKALDSFAQIRNAADSNIFIDQGRFKIGELEPGQTKTVKFVLDVKDAYAQDSFQLKLAIVDEPLEEISTEKIALPVGDGLVKVTEQKGFVKLAEHTPLLGAPTADARPIEELAKGGVLALTGTTNGFDRVDLGNGRFAFVAKDKAREVKTGKVQLKDETSVAFRLPPEVTVNVDASQGGVIATGDKFTLSGSASDPKGLIDLYVLVNDQKVAFETAPAGKSEAKMKFSTEFPLKDGNNYVMVVARETPEFVGKKMLVIRKRPAAIAQALEHEGMRAQNQTLPPTERPAEMVTH